MASAEPTGEASRPPDHARSPVAAFTRASDLPKATVRFDAGSEGLEERDWPGATFREEPDGSVLAEIPFASSGWIARRIAARLGRAEVLAPLELRRSVAETARALLEA
jgi:predicted DNA-binding transcriptional regulator YafY